MKTRYPLRFKGYIPGQRIFRGTTVGVLICTGGLGWPLNGALAQTHAVSRERVALNSLLLSNVVSPMPNIEPPALDASQYLPDIAPEIRLVISLSDRQVYVYDRDKLVDKFPIAVGKSGWETPIGNYKVLQMVREPAWENPFTGGVIPPGRQNPLGSRWIAFWTDGKNFIGFHGTPNEGSVGQAASHGCIRMFENHVQQLFEIVQIGTPVQVVP